MSDEAEQFPLNPFFMASVQLHEAYMSLIESGFTREESMQVFLVILQHQLSSV